MHIPNTNDRFSRQMHTKTRVGMHSKNRAENLTKALYKSPRSWYSKRLLLFHCRGKGDDFM